MNTIYVNLFGGPCVGKSTHAAGLFYKLKIHHYNCELIQEYAKDIVWREASFTLKCQPYVTGKQLYRQYTVLNKVDVAITDSPLITGLVYPGFGSTAKYRTYMLEMFSIFNNFNIFLKRDESYYPYSQIGRTQNELEAKQKDIEIYDMLKEINADFLEVTVSDDSLDTIYNALTKKLAEIKMEENEKN